MADSEQVTPTPSNKAAQHEDHPNCPDSLTCLPDTCEQPRITLAVILRCAILGSPHKRLTLQEIYAAMETKYPFYTEDSTWKGSVQHQLSLNRLFERQPRPHTHPGYGSYWTVNLSAPTGTKRPRKRGQQPEGQRDQEDNNSPLIPRVSLPSLACFESSIDVQRMIDEQRDCIICMQTEIDDQRDSILRMQKEIDDQQKCIIRLQTEMDEQEGFFNGGRYM